MALDSNPCDSATVKPSNTELRLSSGNGPVTRTVLNTPLRNAKVSEIPIIDLSTLFSESFSSRQAVAQQMHDAASNMGFFYVKNHGIEQKATRSAFSAALDFFKQDREEKLKADATDGPYDSGWRGPKTQRVNPDEGTDVRETYSVLYESRFDPTVKDASRIPLEAARYISQGKSAFEGTEQVPHLKECLEQYFKSCLILARALTRAFALSLDLPEDAFDKKVQYPDASLEINFYPSLTRKTGNSSAARKSTSPGVSIGSHTDFLLFTMLWQDDVGGLQVLNHEGQWIAAPPREGTLVVNIGDYMQRITNNRYVSAVHRARNESGRERVSMPFFWGFGMHESCEVLENCRDENGNSEYEEISCADWVSTRLGHLFDMESSLSR